MGTCSSTDDHIQNTVDESIMNDRSPEQLKSKNQYMMKSGIEDIPPLPNLELLIKEEKVEPESVQRFIPQASVLPDHSSIEQIPEQILNQSLIEQHQEQEDPIAFHSPSSQVAIITKEKFVITKSVKDIIQALGNFNLPKPDQSFLNLPEIGVVEYQNQIQYLGQYCRGKRHGLGQQTWGDGSFYKGYFLDDQIHGFGRMAYYNGDYYLGEWQMNQSDGKGKYVDVQGNSYDGQWQASKQHGQGKEIQANGQTYEGSYLDGMQHGEGKLVTKEFKYVGEFKFNQMDGQGQITWNDTRSYKGEFQENLLHGYGVFTWKESRYSGYYVKSLKEGFGQMEYGDGKVYEGQWKNGYQDGKGHFLDLDGDEKKGIWKKGRLLQN